MQRASRFLADYVIHKGMVDENDREIYEYGFMLSLEAGIFILFCFLMTVFLRMYVNGILFFVVFAPLRSYAGGLHLKRYQSCFILSCLTFSAVLLITKYVHIPNFILGVTLVALEILVYCIYPVENTNRKVDESEDRYFKERLGKFLVFDLIIGMVCVVAGRSDYLMQIVVIFFVVVITMIIGKYMNNRESSSL